MGKKQKKSCRVRRKKQAAYQGFKVNRKYKDSLFRMIFKSREALLSLYNAINKSGYENPDDLEITTLEDVIYIGIKNDASFLIDSFMNLYEAQSTKNPNMPLRGLMYFAQLYQSYAAQYQLNLYFGSRKVIPTPQYMVFYNGTAPAPEVSEYRLSDSFEHRQEKPCLEQHKGRLEDAVDCAVSQCINENILKEFLTRHRTEVKAVILTEYDAKQHIEAEKSESYLEGKTDGETKGENRFAALSLKLLQDGEIEALEKAAKDKQFRWELYGQYGI